jgi:serralysin
MNRLLLTGLVVAAGFVAQPAIAETQFMAIITHDQEVTNPPIPNEGSSGIGFFVLNDAQNALSYDVTFTGLDLDGLQTPNNPNDNVTRTHFHAAPSGQNGGIVFGQIDPNNDLDDRVLNPVTGRITGVWDGTEGNGTTLAAQLANLLAGNLYFNVHTSDHAGGEIRGQVRIIPEPGTWLLGILGCTLGCLVWRRRRS